MSAAGIPLQNDKIQKNKPANNKQIQHIQNLLFFTTRYLFCIQPGIPLPKKNRLIRRLVNVRNEFLIVIKPGRRVPPEVFRPVQILWFPAKPTL